MKVKVLKRFAIDGYLFEPGQEVDLPEGIALRKQAQGEVKRIIVTPRPKVTYKSKKQHKVRREDKRLDNDVQENKDHNSPPDEHESI